MTMPVAFLVRTRMRSIGAVSLLSLLVVGLGVTPGCLDQGGSAPPACTAGQVVDTSSTDCKQSVCLNGVLADQPDNTEIPEDMNPCTVDSCADGVVKNDPKADGEICMLGNTVGVCTSGACVVTCSGPSNCDDANPCTADSCGADKKCAFMADDAVVPDDQNPCTMDSCAGGVAKHDNAPMGTECGPNAKCDGMGTCMGCTMDSQCPADTECLDNFCDVPSGSCKSMPKADGPIADAQDGDCQSTACAAGVVVSMPDDSDVPMSPGECVVVGCNAGAPTSMPKNAQAPCSMGVCDGMGACVECVGTNNCMLDFTCSMNKCFSCKDGMTNGTETDLDCGGECIARCVRGQMCKVTADCDGECDNNVCVDCFDFTKNGTEGDVDCGGVCAAKCNANQSCNLGSDCSTGVCVGNKCAAPTCNDGVKNGAETDIDCGGGICTKCGSGKKCTKNSDCVSNNCNAAGTCT